MSLKKYIFAGLIGIVSLGSCTYLDKEPDTEIDIDMVFENKTKVESWLANVYSRIPNPGNDWLNTYGWEVFADDLTASARWQQWDWPNITKILGGWTPNTQWAGNFWDGLPQKIRQAYIFIERVHALPEADLSQKEVDYMKAEARFLAAYYWWQLLETYGPIPFRPNYIAPTDFTLSDLMVGQRPFDEIVSHLDNEMLEAAKQLPPVWQSVEKYGRITSVMCLTIRAKMLLFAASPLVNGNEWYIGHKNKEGEELFNSTYSQEKWVKAAEACKLLLDEADQAGYRLYVEYNAEGEIDPFTSLENVWFTKFQDGNKEILFPYTKQDAYQSYQFYTNKAVTKEYGGGNGLGVYQGLVDAFFMKNGLPITDDNAEYVEGGFSTEKEIRVTEWTGGTGQKGEVTAEGTYNMYCNREPRFYTTVSYNGSWYALAGRKYEFFKNQKDNDYTHDAPQNGYLVRKSLCMTDNKKTGVYTSRQGFTYRLAFTYLDYAEANNEAYDTSAARELCLKYLNKVRERAGVRQYTFDAVSDLDENFIHIENTQAAVRKVVKAERRVELCLENNRWYDLRRWKDVENTPEMIGDDYGMNSEGTTNETFFKRTVYQTRVWKRCYYWMPVFIDEYEKNPNLVQTPFWLE